VITYFDITNESAGAMSKSSSIKVNASAADGVSFSWTGYNGVNYTTAKMSWDDFAAKNYSIKLSDLYNDPKFYASDGVTPLLDAVYKIKPITSAKPSDIANTINGTEIYNYVSSPLSARFEDASGTQVGNAFLSSLSASISYQTAYDSFISGAASAYDFNVGVDDVLVPSPSSGNLTTHPAYSTVDAAKNDSTGFEFTFDMAGIGTVTAKLTSVSYASGDRSDDAEGIWWNWYKNPRTGAMSKTGLLHSVSPTLAGLMDSLTGNRGSTPGMLSSANGGCSDSGGTASLTFTLYSGGNQIGSIGSSFGVSNTDTEDSVLTRIKNGLNSSTVLDLYTTTSAESNKSAGRTYAGSVKANKIDSPLYQATNCLSIQAGSEAGQHIDIIYDSLDCYMLNIADASVDTIPYAEESIGLIKDAMQIISAQRTDFGAYQNRMEHTIKNLDNVVENTTSAESKIRDTDMAKEMVQMSIANILEQTGISMMTQANQQSQAVLNLLS